MCSARILITGSPGVGKTTLIRAVIERLGDLRPAGFYTREIREGKNRIGFELIGLDGRREILAHTMQKGPYRVGKYRVNLKGFEEFLDGLPVPPAESGLVVIDEIGRMESFSPNFRKLIHYFLNAPVIFLATISLKGDRFIEEIRERDDVILHQVTRENRDELVGIIVQEIRSFCAENM